MSKGERECVRVMGSDNLLRNWEGGRVKEIHEIRVLDIIFTETVILKKIK